VSLSTTTLQNAPTVRTVLTTAVTHAVHTVLAVTVITLTGPVPGDVNQDTTLTRVSFATQVNIDLHEIVFERFPH